MSFVVYMAISNDLCSQVKSATLESVIKLNRTTGKYNDVIILMKFKPSKI